MTVFPVLAGDVQFNHAGVTPLPRPVAEAMKAYIDDWSWRGQQPWAYLRLGALRSLAAKAVGATSADEMAIVPNTSTGLATVARGLSLGAGDVIVTTAVEFPANRYPWDDRARDGATVVVVEPSDARGWLLDDAAIVAAMREGFPKARQGLLAISHIQFASGQEHDIPALCAEAHALGGLVCVDGIQAVGQMPLDVEGWGVDFLAADGHKWMLGPEGCGILYVRAEHLERLRPPMVGWTSIEHPLDWDTHDFTLAASARRYETGCHNLVGAIGLAAGLDLLLTEGLERVQRSVRSVATELAEAARSAGLHVISAHGPDRGNGIVALDAGSSEANQTLHSKLKTAGIHSAVRRGILRLSPHFYNTAEQVGRVSEALRG